MAYILEFTDLYGGQANYGWLHRLTIEGEANMSRRILIRNAKRAFGIAARHYVWVDAGDFIELRFSGMLTTLMITWDYADDPSITWQ